MLALSGVVFIHEAGETIGAISGWCERVSGGIFREPSNTLSNIGFMLAGLLMLKVLSEDFSLYIHRPTATDNSFAPAGCDSFYVLCPVPNLLGNIDWKIEAAALKKRIILALNSTILPSLIDVITDEFYMTPEDFAADYRSMYGAGFSIAPIFRQSAWFRFHNRDSKLNNLYFTGAGTHPGAGVPGVVSSAKVVEKLILEDDKLKS